MRRRLLSTCIAMTLVAAACAGDDTVGLDAADATEAVVSELADVSDRPETLAIAEQPTEALTESEPTDATTEVQGAVDTQASDPTSCVAPALQGHFVDVALDDPDGGLNLREDAGPTNSILATIERGKELIPTGECSVVGSTEWWQVTTSDGSLLGWVSSNFLSERVILTPGLGRVEQDADNVGLFAESIDGLAAQLAIIYGFGEDVGIGQVGDLVGVDATSGIAVYHLTGLRDDSSNGYRVEILFFIERDETGDEVLGFSASRIDRQSLCTRGVTDDGLCV